MEASCSSLVTKKEILLWHILVACSCLCQLCSIFEQNELVVIQSPISINGCYDAGDVFLNGHFLMFDENSLESIIDFCFV